jgi:hypothetical protein
VSSYRVTLGAYTHSGRHISTEQIEVPDADAPSTAFIKARREFFARTALVSGVWVEIRQIEREHDGNYFPLIAAHEATPGTWVRVLGQWRRVARWEPQGDGTCRLYTGAPGSPYARKEGVYARNDVFETR